jgi:pantoate--beta-alanine ligase
VRPDIALFGEKDFQQLAVIRRMVDDLGIPVEIVGVPTFRDADGLALSSRNALLSADERQRAVALPTALGTARNEIRNGSDISAALQKAKQSLVDAGFLDRLSGVGRCRHARADRRFTRRNEAYCSGGNRLDPAHRQPSDLRRG